MNERWRSGVKDMLCWRQECYKLFCKEFYDPILELGKGVLDRLKRRFHIRCMRSSGCAFCVSGVFVGKEEAAHSGDPLTGSMLIVILARAMGQATWRGSVAAPMSALVLPRGVHFPSAYIWSFQLLRFLCRVVHVLSRHRTLPEVGGHVG